MPAAEMQQELCTVVVSSCDGYADIWPAFFTLLDRRWPDRPWPLVLNTESLPAPFSQVQTLHTPQKTSWTRRLQGVLARLETPYVLILLDDFFLTAPVDTAQIDLCIERMQANDAIACFSFYPTTGNLPKQPFPGWEQRPVNGLYRFNAQAGIWRRERLISFLDADEDAWEWENKGNQRSFVLADLFYSRAADAAPVFSYDFMRHGLIGGRWFPETADLFAAEGIQMDFSRRGFYDPDQWALLPSVASAFTLDSVLYPDTGAGFVEQLCLTDTDAPKTGSFTRQYSLPVGTRRLRWDPSTRRGFCLQELTFTLLWDNRSKTLAPDGGNGVYLPDGSLCFLAEDPQLTLTLPKNLPADLRLTVTGKIQCPITLQQLQAARIGRRPVPSFLRRLWAKCKPGGTK